MIAIATALIGTSAAAQQSAAPSGDDGYGDIVVTAQKREQSLQDVGLSIAALDERQLREQGVASASQVAESVAGVQVYNYIGSQPTFVIRGIGVQDFAPNIAPAAALYLDEVYIGSNILSGFQVFDTARVEVLKGPQGDLFGRNTTGGAVSYTTNRPTRTFEGYVEAGIANYQSYTLDAALSGPIAPTLSARVAGRYARQDKGHYTNDWIPADTALPLSPLFFDPKRNPGRSEDWAARLLLLWEPVEGGSVLLNAHGGEKHADIIPLTPIGFSSIPGAAQPCGATALGGNYVARYCGDAFGYTDLDGEPYRVRVDFVGRNRQTNYGASLRAEARLGKLLLTSITAYDDAGKRNFTDTDGAPHHEMNQLRDTKLEQFTQEVRLAADPADDFYWIAGLYGAREKIDLRFLGTLSPALGFTNFADPAVSGRPASGLELNFSQDTLSAAAFGHAEWRMDERLTLILGLRYTYERKDFFSQSEWLYNDGRAPQRVLVNFGSTAADAARIDDRDTFSALSGKIGLNFKLSDSLLVFGSVSRGFKSGGFDGDFAFTRAQLEPFSEETLTAYELGWKATLLDRRLYLNGSAYYYDFQDPQVRVAQVDPVTRLPFNQLNNLASARVIGGELDISWRPARGASLRGGLSINDSRISDPAQPVFDGNQLPLASPVSATFAARYETAIGGGWSIAGLVDGKYSDPFYLNPENTGYLRQDAMVLLNARLTLASEHGWEVALWGRNLTRQTYAVQAFALFGAYPVAYSPPRTYGLSARFDW
jgi:iron complex outermembrane receptor protein